MKKKPSRSFIIRGMRASGYDARFIAQFLGVQRCVVFNVVRDWEKHHPERRRRRENAYWDKGKRGNYRSGKQYTQDENMQILAHTTPDGELAKKLQRSHKAIITHRGDLLSGRASIR